MRNSQESLCLKSWRWSWCARALSTKDWSGTAAAAGAAETVDGGDVTGLGKWSATIIPLYRQGDGAKRRVFGKDAHKEELGERELCGGVCGGHCVGQQEWVRPQAEWGRAGLSALRRPVSSQTCAWRQ